MEEKVYTVKDVAKAMNVNEETIRRWVRSGVLKCSRYRGRGGNRFTESDLKDFKKDKAVKRPEWREMLETKCENKPDVNEVVENKTIDEHIAELELAVGLLSAELEYWKRIKAVLGES